MLWQCVCRCLSAWQHNVEGLRSTAERRWTEDQSSQWQPHQDQVWTASSASYVSWQQQHTHTRLTALCPGLPRWAGTRKVKPIWILLKQETVSGSGISWAICKSAHRCRQITMPASHHSVLYRPDALPAAQPTVLKHCRYTSWQQFLDKLFFTAFFSFSVFHFLVVVSMR